MALDRYIQSGGKRLRCGYTTGVCAALAADGAARLLLTGQAPSRVSLLTPKGWPVQAQLLDCHFLSADTATAAVEKDAGDDVDVTAGAHIYADVSLCAQESIRIDGGAGVGRVTKPGLDQPVGAAAINRVPRRMIEDQLRATARELGIVEPMSQQALVDTIALEIRQARAGGHTSLLLTPGNYGEAYLHARGLDALGAPVVKCSNFIGDALDTAHAEGFSAILLVGHIGKLVKLAGGIMNTHSRYADCRTELFCAHAAVCGADTELCRSLLGAATADACIELLDRYSLRGPVMESLVYAADDHLTKRAAGGYTAGAIFFSNTYGTLGETSRVPELLRLFGTQDTTKGGL